MKDNEDSHHRPSPGKAPAGDSEEHILASWRDNADAWTRVIREGGIASREAVTNAAVLDAVMAGAPQSALDMGCGEGWLVRALAERGVRCVGLDATAELVHRAGKAGGGEFHQCSYSEFAQAGWPRQVDAAVFNFSLLGKEIAPVLTAAGRALNPGGRCVIQTLHPAFACPDDGYTEGWREGSWQGFDPRFHNPAPWYFRPLGSWLALLERCGLRLLALPEPLDPEGQRPLSMLLIAEPRPGAL